MLHEIIIWATVLIIIGLQVKIFLETKNKIKSYESIMKNPQSFKTYKVYISEKEIETIDSQHILDNLNHYSKNPTLRSIEDIKSDDNIHLSFDFDNEDENALDDDIFDIDDDLA